MIYYKVNIFHELFYHDTLYFHSYSKNCSQSLNDNSTFNVCLKLKNCKSRYEVVVTIRS